MTQLREKSGLIFLLIKHTIIANPVTTQPLTTEHSNMLNAAQLQDCIGKVEGSPEVAQLLAELGVKKKLKRSSEGDAMVERPELGLILAFEPAGPRTSV